MYNLLKGSNMNNELRKNINILYIALSKSVGFVVN